MRALCASVLVSLVLLVSPATASAGTYDVWSCQLPDGRPAPVDGWSPIGGAFGSANQCSTRQGLTVVLPNARFAEQQYSGWQFTAPSGVTIAGYEVYRRAKATLGPDGSEHDYLLFHDAMRVEPGYLTDYCIAFVHCSAIGDVGSADLLDPDNRLEREALSLRRLLMVVQCKDPQHEDGCDPHAVPGELKLARARIRLEDVVPPVLGPPTGALVTGGAVLEGPQSASIVAMDRESGVRRLLVVVDGSVEAEQSVADPRGTCRAPYVARVPCPASASQIVGWDTQAVPNGRHVIQIAAEDAAGNRTTSAAKSVTVVNGGVPNGARPTRRARLSIGFRRNGGASLSHTVVDGEARPVLAGRLVTATGMPIPQAFVEIVRTPARPGARSRLEGTTRTDRRGRFRFRVRRGPSRRLTASYRAFSLDPEPSAEAVASLRVHARLRLRVRPRRTTARGRIVFAGQLLGGPGRTGVEVTIYAVDRHGRRRVPVSVLTTDSRGRFNFDYRFLRTFAPFTYRFVARLEPQTGYPYAAGTSPIATIRIVR